MTMIPTDHSLLPLPVEQQDWSDLVEPIQCGEAGAVERFYCLARRSVFPYLMRSVAGSEAEQQSHEIVLVTPSSTAMSPTRRSSQPSPATAAHEKGIIHRALRPANNELNQPFVRTPPRPFGCLDSRGQTAKNR